MAASIAADFLGVRLADLSTPQVTNTVTEMLNMLSGSTLGHYDPAVTFDLGIPRKIDVGKAQAETVVSLENITCTALQMMTD